MAQFIKVTKVYIGANGRYASEYLINKDAIKYVNSDEEGGASEVQRTERRNKRLVVFPLRENKFSVKGKYKNHILLKCFSCFTKI